MHLQNQQVLRQPFERVTLPFWQLLIGRPREAQRNSLAPGFFNPVSRASRRAVNQQERTGLAGIFIRREEDLRTVSEPLNKLSLDIASATNRKRQLAQDASGSPRAKRGDGALRSARVVEVPSLKARNSFQTASNALRRTGPPRPVGQKIRLAQQTIREKQPRISFEGL